MLLCCFKEKKTKKRDSYDVNGRGAEAVEADPAYQPTRNSIISDRSLTPPASGRRLKEKAPLQREEKKLLKQQQSRDSLSSWKEDPPSHFPYIDSSTATEAGSPGGKSEKFLAPSYNNSSSSCSSPINNNKIGSAENNYTQRAQPEIIRICSSTLSSPSKPYKISTSSHSVKSVPNLNSVGSISSSAPSPVHSIHSANSLQQFSHLSSLTQNNNSSYHNHNGLHAQNVCGLPPICPITATSVGASAPLRKEKVQTRGMTRSSASYGIQQMLQEQIIQEEKSKEDERLKEQLEAAAKSMVLKYETQINDLKNQHGQRIQELERTYRISLNNAKNKSESELKWKVSKYEHDLDQCRKSHHHELEQAEKKFDQSLVQEKEEHQQLVKEFKSQEDTWKQEKQEVFSEIQRLKDEANRFIAILSAEDESDDHLSLERKQTLTREVESLQLVVEMRTQEVHRLREEQAKQQAKLEELDFTKDSLARMRAKVEDLQAQLVNKSANERQLSLDKSNLENDFQLESKNKDIISRQMEELQFRIQHKMEVPALQVFHSTSSFQKNGPDPGSKLPRQKSMIPQPKYLKEPMQKETIEQALPSLSEPSVEARCDIEHEVVAVVHQEKATISIREDSTANAAKSSQANAIPVTSGYSILKCQNLKSNQLNNNAEAGQMMSSQSQSHQPDLMPVLEDINKNDLPRAHVPPIKRHSAEDDEHEELLTESDENANNPREREESTSDTDPIHASDSLECLDNAQSTPLKQRVDPERCPSDEGLGGFSNSNTPSPQKGGDFRRKKSSLPLMLASEMAKIGPGSASPSSPPDERMPSRIPFSIRTAL
eukprot:maker-scaffold441_size170131-snap-gene-0.31 protein:Tk02636 transcript:maker-scaffold441_size170131-snap-gene-0.31-mRNA-1 annotation:"microtubule-associated tumor suppressor candidate 2 homolog isoform x2"